MDGLTLRLHAITFAAQGTNFFELRDPGGGQLPPFTPGAHVDVLLGNGLVRQYSLVNTPEDRARFVLGIKRSPQSRGGSDWAARDWRVGDLTTVGYPRNNFTLHSGSAPSVLIGGGIGITPLMCMAKALEHSGREWQLYYAVHERSEAIDLSDLDPRRVHLHVDDEHGGRPLPLPGVLASAPADAHLYCCGPSPMLEAFETLTASRDRSLVHLERFTGVDQPAVAGGFELALARSNKRVFVASGERIVDALRRIGVDVQTSCEQGICGSCETRVVTGEPDHRDLLLSEEEKATNRAMMICCSGSRSDLLVLDL